MDREASKQARHKSNRLQGFDYGSNAAYVVTICSDRRREIFSRIVDGEVQLTDVGQILREELLRTANLRKYVLLDEFIIMPNHFHAIVILNDASDRKIVEPGRVGRSGPSETISAIVRGFKSACSSRVRRELPEFKLPLWQLGFHDRVVRDEPELGRFREYIANNPRQWELDRYYRP